MNRILINLFGIVIIILGLSIPSNAQLNLKWTPSKGCIVDQATGECVFNSLLTTVPFLRITPDARSGALGDAGLATSPDPNGMHYNASKLAFAKEDISIATTYTPWLRAIGIDDIYMAYLTAFKKIDDLQAFGMGLRFFSLGTIEFTDNDGNPLDTGRPREFELSMAYARKLSETFSASLTGKYIYSNLANGQIVGGNEVRIGQSFAIDLGATYKGKVNISGKKHNLTVGAAMTNIGSKISYIEGRSDFIPSNLGIGAALDLQLDAYNVLTFTMDVNKLLVPTPIRNKNDPNYLTWRDQPLFQGIFRSFSDAEGGITEELQEITISTGVEYWYDQQFAMRAGYFYENTLKGGRQFLTMGVGLKYNVYGMNFSYLIPTGFYRSPLANTLRFTLVFDFRAFDENDSQ